MYGIWNFNAMKIFFAGSVILLSLGAGAQEIKVKSGSEKFSTGHHDALLVSIYDASKDDVMSAWKKKLNNFKDEKVKWNGNEIFGDNIVISDWGNDPVDIYSVFEEDKGEKTVKMAVAVDLGGAYLSQSGDKKKYKFMENLIKEFAVDITKDAIKENVNAAEKVLSKLESEERSLEKDNNNLKNDIEDYKKKIAKAESEIKSNEESQSKKKSEIEAQKKITEEVKAKLKKVD